ncbi:MAG: hypothetical protein ACUVXG_12835 [Anaerolineae bacterium]
MWADNVTQDGTASTRPQKAGKGGRPPQDAGQLLSQSLSQASTGLFALLAAVAVGVRLVGLAGVRMEGGEAAEAVAAWCLAQAQPCASTHLGTSPLLFAANLLAFGLGTASDLWARWLPVVVGGLLVALPCLLNRAMGRGAAFWASLTLAFSATALYVGRHLSPDAIAVTFAALAWAAVVADAHERTGKRLWLTAVALALALCTGATAYTVLLALGTWAALSWWLGARLSGEPLLGRWWGLVRADGGRTRRALTAGGLVFLLTATAFALRPVGLGLAADLLAGWFGRFAGPATYPWYWLPRLLLLQEPLILLAGLAGLALAIIRRDRLGLSLGWWALVALIVSVAASGRRPDDLTAVLVPLGLLAGQALDALVGHLRAQRSLQPEAGFLVFALALLVFGYVEMATYTLRDDPRYLLLAAIPGVLILALLALWWLWHGRGPALRGLALWVWIWAAVASLAVAGNLNFNHDLNRMEGMVAEETTPNLEGLVAWLERLSVQRHVDPHALPLLVVGYDRPILRWALREFPRVRFVEGIAAPPDETAVLSPVGRELPLGETFTGQDFEVTRRGLPTGLKGKDLVRWLLFRDNVASVDKDALILWVKREREE